MAKCVTRGIGGAPGDGQLEVELLAGQAFRAQLNLLVAQAEATASARTRVASPEEASPSRRECCGACSDKRNTGTPL